VLRQKERGSSVIVPCRTTINAAGFAQLRGIARGAASSGRGNDFAGFSLKYR
jgi:hypothetical protein